MINEYNDISVEKQFELLRRLEKAIKAKYPSVNTEVEQENPDDPVFLVVMGEETIFSIGCRPGSKGKLFYVDANWSEDEAGKRKLPADQMVKAVGSIIR